MKPCLTSICMLWSSPLRMSNRCVKSCRSMFWCTLSEYLQGKWKYSASFQALSAMTLVRSNANWWLRMYLVQHRFRANAVTFHGDCGRSWFLRASDMWTSLLHWSWKGKNLPVREIWVRLTRRCSYSCPMPSLPRMSTAGRCNQIRLKLMHECQDAAPLL